MPEQPQETTGTRPAPVFPGRGGPGGRPHFLRGPVVKPKDTGKTLYRLWRYLRHRWVGLAAVLLLVLTSSALNLVSPYLIGRAIDRYIIPGDFRGLPTLTVGVLKLLILSHS